MQKDELTTYCIPLDVVVVEGADAASYLHGQLSQNVSGLAVGEAAFSLLLEPQGFVTAWMRVVRRGEDLYWLVVDHGFGQSVVERLNRFKLRVDCQISSSEMKQTSIRSASPEAELAWPSVSPDFVRVDAVWPDDAGLDVLGPKKLELDGCREGSADDFEVRRIRSGRPAMGSELTEKTIPASVGVVDLSVDFTKGCYVGQELVARVDSRGNNTPTTLYRLEFAGEAAPGDDICDEDGKKVGSLSSVAFDGPNSIGLAFLKRGTSMEKLTVAANGGPLVVKVVV